MKKDMTKIELDIEGEGTLTKEMGMKHRFGDINIIEA